MRPRLRGWEASAVEDLRHTLLCLHRLQEFCVLALVVRALEDPPGAELVNGRAAPSAEAPATRPLLLLLVGLVGLLRLRLLWLLWLLWLTTRRHCSGAGSGAGSDAGGSGGAVAAATLWWQPQRQRRLQQQRAAREVKLQNTAAFNCVICCQDDMRRSYSTARTGRLFVAL
jgi:hypothetical protein